MSEPQRYATHVRMHPPFHYVLVPLLALHLIYSVIQLIRFPDLERAEAVMLAIALLIMAFLVRVNPLKAQDRLIRLEEELRYARLLSDPLACRTGRLTTGQILALRFASDQELPSLVERVLEGGLAQPSDIKKAIRNWRGDYFRV